MLVYICVCVFACWYVYVLCGIFGIHCVCFKLMSVCVRVYVSYVCICVCVNVYNHVGCIFVGV